MHPVSHQPPATQSLYTAKKKPGSVCSQDAAMWPHRGVWRNGLLFSPTTKYGSYSYADVMIRPLAEALRDSLAAASALGKLATPPDRARPVVYVALTGRWRQVDSLTVLLTESRTQAS